MVETPLVLSDVLLNIAGSLPSSSDVNIFYFSATSGQYLGINLVSTGLAKMGVFYHDTQGTGDSSDDTYELVVQYDWTTLGALFQGMELAYSGEYFIVLGSDASNAFTYSIDIALTNSDLALASAFNAQLGEEADAGKIILENGAKPYIGYVSDNKRPNKQLVYLNFDGGTTNQINYTGSVTINAFNANVLDDNLAGQTDPLIYGDVDMGVTGILDNLETIFTTIPASMGSLPVHFIDLNDVDDLALYNDPDAKGLFFTLNNPDSIEALGPDADFTTIFIGETDYSRGDLFGIASNIDVAGMNPNDQAIIFTEAFANLASGVDNAVILNQYSIALSAVIAHELGHTLGLNHQPTDRTNEHYLLLNDDPDNSGPALSTDANGGQPGLMAYTPYSVMFTQLAFLGTAPLSPEFGIGDDILSLGSIDTAQLLINWFGTPA